MKLFIRPIQAPYDGKTYSYALATIPSGEPKEEQVLEYFAYNTDRKKMESTALGYYRAESVEDGEAYVA